MIARSPLPTRCPRDGYFPQAGMPVQIPFSVGRRVPKIQAECPRIFVTLALHSRHMAGVRGNPAEKKLSEGQIQTKLFAP
jgi:hypothetical protein